MVVPKLGNKVLLVATNVMVLHRFDAGRVLSVCIIVRTCLKQYKIVVELMDRGDLHNYLISVRPK